MRSCGAVPAAQGQEHVDAAAAGGHWVADTEPDAWMALKLVRRRVEDEAAVLGRHDAGGAARERRERWLEALFGGR